MSPGQHSVTIVDDDPDFLDFVATLVCRLGYRAISFLAPVGPKHLSEILAADVVITDLFMPQFDGFELVRAIRQENRTLPIVMMSSSSQPHGRFYLEASERLGADFTLCKTEVALILPELLRSMLGTPQPAAGH